MTRRRLSPWVAVVALLCLGVAPATARVVTGVDVAPAPDDPLATAGQRHEGRLVIACDHDLILTELRLDGPGWRGLTWDNVGFRSLRAGDTITVLYAGTPDRADDPLHVTLSSDLLTVHRTLVLGGPELERAGKPRPLRRGLGGLTAPPRAPGAVSWSPEPVQTREPLARDGDSRYAIRIHGRFLYIRDGDTVLGAEGFTVNVYDGDPGVDDYLGNGGTDWDGYFDFTVNWTPQWDDADPDLKLEFEAQNSEVRIQPGGGALVYLFELGGWANFAGTDLDVGNVMPDDESDMGIPHLLTNSTRNWRYVAQRGHDTRFLEVHWPSAEDDGAYYNSVSETIHLPRSTTWESSTLAHEYGHHIMECLGEMPGTNYCNGICDNSLTDCGHCAFCREDEAVAWAEGWADYIGHVVPRTYAAIYGLPAINLDNFESLAVCSQDDTWHDPDTTEGFTAAALVDLDDAANEDDPHTVGYDDRITLGGELLLDLLDREERLRTMPFLRDVLAELPDQREAVWWTVRNNTFDLDEEPPDPVYPIVCSTHTPGVPSANPEITFLWQRPDDDASGVSGYVSDLRAGSPASPFGYPEPGTSRTFSNVAPGTYYFCIRTVDNAGNFTGDYTSSGPYVITEPEPRNLVFELRTGWWSYVVPRNTQDATLNSCPAPTTLTSQQPTYWNLAGRNEGDLATGADLITALEIDGNEVDRFNWGNLPGWSPFVVLNRGPENVYGGLHTVIGSIDPDNDISETAEGDNARGKQFAWRPPLIAANQLNYLASSIPRATGGWNWVSDWVKFYNCYGVGIQSSGWWNAMVVWSTNPLVDHDLRLYEPDTGPLAGYRWAREVSGQPAGWADVVVVNRNLTGNLPWDVGIVNETGQTASARYAHLTSVEVAFPDSAVEVMGTNEYVLLREFEVGVLETGGISLDVWTDPPQADVLVTWYDVATETADLLAGEAVALTGPDGHARVDVVADDPGYTCLVICRQPNDGDAPLAVTYRIRPTLPDLAPGWPAAWHAPIVPRPDEAGAPGGVALPTGLVGDAASTYYNFAVTNASTGTALGAMRFHVMVDEGVGSFSDFHVFDIPGLTTRTFNDQGPRTVRGGRHLVVLDLDRDDHMVELDETNNTYGEQYVWTPVTLGSGASVVRDAPPDRTGGLADLASGDPFFYNCDAVRAAYTGTYWRAVAVMPGPASDVDLRLHEAAVGVQSGFSTWLANSGWGPGCSDYVLVNFNVTARRAFDVGVLGYGGDEDYALEVENEFYLGEGAVTHGPVSLPAGQIMDLYEIFLDPDVWTVRVENLAGAVDWGLTVHPADQAYLAKSASLDGGLAVWNDAGEDEQVQVTVPVEGYHAITVWKSQATDLDLPGEYILHVIRGPVVGVGDLPTATALDAVYPNPFNPQTTVAFDLAQAGDVDLSVYDPAGRRVATLLHGDQPAGRHQVVWRGQDDGGRRQASGVYLVRLRAGEVTDLRKVLLVK
ncbi:MAG: FlgD immunoglobulin-like domain containing protein [Candidatus Krumholzibacteriia bacterium]